MKKAQKVVPLRSKVGRAFTSFGAFAMKPQVAIAAVFVVMIGASVVFLGQKSEKSVATTAAGPEQSARSATTPAATQEIASKDEAKASASASTAPQATVATLEPEAPRGAANPTPTLPMASATTAPAHAANAADDKRLALAEQLPPAAPRTQSRAAAAPPPPPNAAPPVAQAFRALDGKPEAKKEGELGGPRREEAASGAAPGGSAALAQARAAFDAGRFNDAFRVYDGLAAANVEAAFQAARSLVKLRRFSEAAQRFDDLSMRAAGTPNEYQAIYEAATCYRAMGDLGAARERLSRLTSVAAFAQVAQRDLAAIGPRKAQAQAPAATTVAPPATATAAPTRPADAYDRR